MDKIEKLIKIAKSKGYNEIQIKEVLRKKGYDTDNIQKSLKTKKKIQKKKCLFALVSIFLILFFICIYPFCNTILKDNENSSNISVNTTPKCNNCSSDHPIISEENKIKISLIYSSCKDKYEICKNPENFASFIYNIMENSQSDILLSMIANNTELVNIDELKKKSSYGSYIKGN